MSGHRPPGGFNLSAVYPGRFQRLDAELTEGQAASSNRHPAHSAAVHLSVLDSAWLKHRVGS
jgi:hypothetical protein